MTVIQYPWGNNINIYPWNVTEKLTLNISYFDSYFVICHGCKLCSEIFESIAFHCCNGVVAR